jgi:putative endonuclease
MERMDRIDSRELGRRGERRAAWFYRLRGYRIVDRNVRSRSGEIDLVVRRGKTLVICEVKTRQTLAAGAGHEAVDREKREQLFRLADRYVVKFPQLQIRYDILSLFWNGRRFIIEHYPDAFQPIADASQPWKWRG